VAVLFSVPNTSLVDLSNNPFLDEAVSTSFGQLQEPGFLNTTHSNLPCPYPVVSKDLIWVRGACALNLDLLWALLLCSAALVGIAAVWNHYRRPTLTSSQSVWRMMSKLGLWVLVVIDLVTDGLFNANMLAYVASVPLSSDQCESMNILFQPALYPSLAIEDYMDANFSDYVAALQDQLALDVYYLLVDETFATELVDSVVAAFESQCRLMDGCMYSDGAYSCIQDSSFEAHSVFVSFVYVVAAVMGVKELVKVGVVVWCTWTARVPTHLCQLCASSAFLPVLALRPKLFWDVLSRKDTEMDGRWAFFMEGMFENIPQLSLAVVYAATVTGNGLSNSEMFSLFVSIVATVHLCVQAVISLRLCSEGAYDRNRESVSYERRRAKSERDPREKLKASKREGDRRKEKVEKERKGRESRRGRNTKREE